MSSGVVDVVVVTYGSRDLVGRCIDSVVGDVLVKSVVVVDHGIDGSGDIAEELGAYVLRDPSNPGFGAGQNHGLAVGAAPFVLLLNPDAVMSPNAISVGVDSLEADDGLAAVQGVLVDDAGRPERSQGRMLVPVHLVGRASAAKRLLSVGVVRALARRAAVLRDHVERVPTGDEGADVEYLAAAALLVRRTALQAIDGFDESYFLYGEDLDLCARLGQAGWRLQALPVPWAIHQSGASAGSWVDREIRWWEGTMGYCARWWSVPRWRAAMVAAAIMWLRISLRRPSAAALAFRAVLREPVALRRFKTHEDRQQLGSVPDRLVKLTPGESLGGRSGG